MKKDVKGKTDKAGSLRDAYYDLFESAPVGYCTVSEEGLILEANLKAASMLDEEKTALINQPFSHYILLEDRDIFNFHLHQAVVADATCELRMLRRDNAFFWASLTSRKRNDATGLSVYSTIITSIDERKVLADEQEMTANLLTLVNSGDGFTSNLKKIVASLLAWSGCEAVGIRLRDGDDFPYYETSGFPPEFVEVERHLCDVDTDGQVLRDKAGNPVLECMCGNVLCGRFDRTKPFFTGRGSFWSNNTTALLASTTDAERLARTRNRCNGEGYESVALIAIRSDSQVVGLIQFNDHRPNRFTPELISHFEKMSDAIAIALSLHKAVDALQAVNSKLESSQVALLNMVKELKEENARRKKSEEALRESEEKFRTLFENSNDAVFLHGLSTEDIGYFIEVNNTACDRYGYTRDEFLLMDPVALDAAGIDGTREQVMSEMRQAGGATFDVVHLTKDGRRIPVEISSRVFDYRGEKHMLSIARDISERLRHQKELEQQRAQLIQADKLASIGTLVAGVAHEINNPTAIIMLNAPTLRDMWDDMVPVIEAHCKEKGSETVGLSDLATIRDLGPRLLDDILRGSDRIKNIVSELKTFARIDNADMTAMIDVNKVVASAVLLVNNRLKNATDHFSVDYTESMPLIRGNYQRLEQVVINLLMNACDALPNRKKGIRLSTGCDEKGGGVTISVRDEGGGMSQETLSQIMTPFYTTKRDSGGTGLGLSISSGIIGAHHGALTYDSELGVGTTATIVLPVAGGGGGGGKGEVLSS